MPTADDIVRQIVDQLESSKVAPTLEEQVNVILNNQGKLVDWKNFQKDNPDKPEVLAVAQAFADDAKAVDATPVDTTPPIIKGA